MTIVASLIALFACLVLLVCLWSLLRPQWLFGFAQPLLHQNWLLPLAIGIRLLLGVALLYVAGHSALPLFFRILGWLSIIAALALPLLGMQRIGRLVVWFEGLPPIAVRLWMLVGTALGVALLFGVRPLLG